jgi:hypothetical protein
MANPSPEPPILRLRPASIWRSTRYRVNDMAEERPLSFLRLIRCAQRGKLKVYLGYGTGVGKTWKMLQRGHRLLKEGGDVVAGRASE